MERSDTRDSSPWSRKNRDLFVVVTNRVVIYELFTHLNLPSRCGIIEKRLKEKDELLSTEYPTLTTLLSKYPTDTTRYRVRSGTPTFLFLLYQGPKFLELDHPLDSLRTHGFP